MVSRSHDFAEHRYVADRLLKIVTGRIGKLLQVVVGAPQFLFLFLLFVNLRVGSDPHGNASAFVAHGPGAREMPTVLSIRAPKPVLEMKWLAGLDRVTPRADILVHIVGMN